MEINADNTIILQVHKGPYTPYLYKGKAYKRNDSATTEIDRLELNRLVLEGINETYEEQQSSKQDLSFVQLEKELSEKLGNGKITADILRTLGLFANGKYNNAAALVADENQHMGIDIIRYGNNINELMDRQTDDNISILNMYHQAVLMYQKYYCYEKIEGSKRIPKEAVPQAAFREALANALVHKLWDVNSRIKISLLHDKIEIVSPGGLPSGISEDEYLNGQISFLRNPIIGNIFFRLGYIEMFGSGIKRIKEAYKDSLSKPEFKLYDNSISVILPTTDIEVKLTDDEQTVLNLLTSSSQKLSRLKIEETAKFSKPKAIRILNSLCTKGLIQKNGSGPNTKYSAGK